ncbi:hypothetical protein ADUPG1_006682 [Aduncisulcus paluster]|uniref:Uncharacterized protein n=1 Tax=Aduncisulcus paluster TaxID=2918883 RepID=A0ABQ5KJ56_9EUKA|nr:hypothetical protein ADUPG1_006682 [Aduncisulcus paluster]
MNVPPFSNLSSCVRGSCISQETQIPDSVNESPSMIPPNPSQRPSSPQSASGTEKQDDSSETSYAQDPFANIVDTGCAKKHQPYLLIPFALTTIGAIGEKAWEFIEHVRRNGTDFMVPGRTREERSRRWASTLLCGLGRGLCIREATCVSSYSWNLIQKKEPKSKGSRLSF